jgi:hypothetical protein
MYLVINAISGEEYFSSSVAEKLDILVDKAEALASELTIMEYDKTA